MLKNCDPLIYEIVLVTRKRDKKTYLVCYAEKL